MAGFNRGHDPLYSTITGLHGIPSDYELALQQQQAGQYDFQADLDMFTNTQFFDFDMAEMPESSSPPQGSRSEGEVWMQNKFVGDQQQQIPHFNNFPNSSVARAAAARAPLANFPQPYSARSSAPTVSSSPSVGVSHQGSDSTERGSVSSQPERSLEPQSLEEASRAAAEEDKRRRNTAASARFRVKKKQREQALEKSAKEMTDRLSWLENRVQTLEMENKLLKDLITEKKGATTMGDKARRLGVEVEVELDTGAEEGRRKGNVKPEVGGK